MKTWSDIVGRWNAAAAALAGSSGAALPSDVRDELFALQNDVLEGLFDTPNADAGALRFVLDALIALSLAEPDDPSHPWARGGVLARVGRHLEAADDFLLAARLFDLEAAAGDGLTGDEGDWAQTARAHAARSLALGGQPVAAVYLLRTLSGEERDAVAPAVEASLGELQRLAAG